MGNGVNGNISTQTNSRAMQTQLEQLSAPVAFFDNLVLRSEVELEYGEFVYDQMKVMDQQIPFLPIGD